MPGLVSIRSTAHDLISETGFPLGRLQTCAVKAGPGGRSGIPGPLYCGYQCGDAAIRWPYSPGRGSWAEPGGPVSAAPQRKPEHDQRHDARVHGRSAVSVGIGPSPADQPPVPTQQGVGRDQPANLREPGEQPDQSGEHCPVGPVQPRPGALPPKHATSWRSTSSSASFDAEERASSTIHPARRTNIR